MDFTTAVTTLANQVDGVSTTRIGEILNERLKRMVADGRWRTEEAVLGTTVADQSTYLLPDTYVVVEDLWIGTDRFDPVSSRELREVQAGRAYLSGYGGVWAEAFDSAGLKYVELFPAPDTTGNTITAQAVVLPSTVSGATELPIPSELQEFLLDGVRATLFREVEDDPGTASAYEDRFSQGIQRMRTRRHSRQGSGPFQLGGSWRR